MKRIACVVFALVATMFSGCASLTGRPAGLTSCQDAFNLLSCTRYKKDELTNAVSLEQTLKVADSLATSYIGARDDNLKFAFWSNALYFPLGIAAAAYTAKKNHANALLNVGIAAGALAAFDTFINARPNAKIYQSGSTAMVCLDTQLRPFVSEKKTQEGDLRESVAELAELVKDADNIGARTDKLLQQDLNSPNAKLEWSGANNTSLATLVSSRQTLASAVADAQKAIDAANAELGKLANVTSYAKNKIVSIDQFVETKITQPDVNYGSFSKSLTPASGSPSAQTGKPTKEVKKTDVEAKANGPLPLRSLTDAAQARIVDLVNKTKDLERETGEFGLSAAEKAIDDCVTAMTGASSGSDAGKGADKVTGKGGGKQ